MAVTYEQASTSTEFIRMAVSATEEGQPINISINAVMAAFLAEGSPTPEADDPEWVAASWETDGTTAPDTYYARALVGPTPGVVTLTPGIWQPWLKIDDSPEITIRKAAGQVRIV